MEAEVVDAEPGMSNHASVPTRCRCDKPAPVGSWVCATAQKDGWSAR
jgi:hypothetical protein